MAACASFLPAQGPAYAARVGGSLRLARLCAHSGALWTLHAGSGPGFAGLSTVACESVGISLPWYGCYPFDGQYMGLWETLDFNAHMPAFCCKAPRGLCLGRAKRPPLQHAGTAAFEFKPVDSGHATAILPASATCGFAGTETALGDGGAPVQCPSHAMRKAR